jgi:regulator of protease activity HflC (stomatin/prohibitin superfamily)
MSILQSIILIVVLLVLFLFSAKITRQYARAVLFRFGRLSGIKGPGLFFIIPFIDQIVRVDFRIRQLDVPKQTIITRDIISVDVDAVIYYRVKDATKAIVEVEDYEAATALIAQTMRM